MLLSHLPLSFSRTFWGAGSLGARRQRAIDGANLTSMTVRKNPQCVKSVLVDTPPRLQLGSLERARCLLIGRSENLQKAGRATLRQLARDGSTLGKTEDSAAPAQPSYMSLPQGYALQAKSGAHAILIDTPQQCGTTVGSSDMLIYARSTIPRIRAQSPASKAWLRRQSRRRGKHHLRETWCYAPSRDRPASVPGPHPPYQRTSPPDQRTSPPAPRRRG